MYTNIPKPTSSNTNIGKPSDYVSLTVDNLEGTINSLTRTVDLQGYIYFSQNKPAASYTSIPKPA